MPLAPCPSCRRHVATTDTTCPFCRTPVAVSPRPTSLAGKLTRAAIFASAASCASTANKPPPPPPPVEYPFALPPAPTEGMASLSGIVRENGRRAAGMPVSARNTSTDEQRETHSNARGEYQFLDLTPGVWEVVPTPDYQNHRPQDGPVMQMPQHVQLAANANQQVDLQVNSPAPYVPDTGPCCKPYGAPPARRRVV